ncbi:hypothetical protein D7294_10775 [Streptomyces hoynatensis]|uniref:VCBS repeat-containing protein n=1 Tax=Streptomyces hoynatensis TaxID=1141874 RepID=A0A3A9Z7N9_9ACTN|nr:hypothetical protein D7294_10775 [Streptomyces hoynatensis]
MTASSAPAVGAPSSASSASGTPATARPAGGLSATAAPTSAAPTTAAPTSAASAAGAAYADFNGDGYPDLAVSHALASVNDRPGAGAVVVFYGSAGGLSAAGSAVLSQASPGVPGAAEAGDRFGGATASADLDGDGYADLLVGSPGEAVGGVVLTGGVTVLWGGRSGLSGGAVLAASGPDLPEGAEEGCRFGAALFTGDVNGDGSPDLTAGSDCGAGHFTGPFTRTGEPAGESRDALTGPVLGGVAGSLDGDAAAERVLLPGPDAGDPGGRVYVDDWRQGAFVRTELTGADGLTGAIADVDGDSYGDLVLGDPVDRVGRGTGGELTVWYGGPRGIDPAQTPTRLRQDVGGVPGSGEPEDAFGAALGVGDTDGDGYADVVVGIPGEDVGDTQDAGAVVVLRGSAAGLTGEGALALHQNAAGVSGAAEYLDLFGRQTRLADFDGDGAADLAVGAPGENEEGCAWFAEGRAGSGITTAGSFGVCASAVGGLTPYGAGFGEVIAP